MISARRSSVVMTALAVTRLALRSFSLDLEVEMVSRREAISLSIAESSSRVAESLGFWMAW